MSNNRSSSMTTEDQGRAGVGRSRRRKGVLSATAVAAVLGLTTLSATAAHADIRFDGPDKITISSAKITSGGVDGQVNIDLFSDGRYIVASHVHNGNWAMRNYSLGCVVRSADNHLMAFGAGSGEIGGRGKLSRGGSKYRNPYTEGTNAVVKESWQSLQEKASYNCRISTKYDIGGLLEDLGKGAGVVATVVAMA